MKERRHRKRGRRNEPDPGVTLLFPLPHQNIVALSSPPLAPSSPSLSFPFPPLSIPFPLFRLFSLPFPSTMLPFLSVHPSLSPFLTLSFLIVFLPSFPFLLLHSSSFYPSPSLSFPSHLYPSLLIFILPSSSPLAPLLPSPVSLLPSGQDGEDYLGCEMRDDSEKSFAKAASLLL